VCHVPARQDRAKNDSTFAEGLLDWAAYHFFELWAAKLDLDFAPAAQQHATELRRVLTRSADPAGSARRFGHEAADTVAAWLEDEPLLEGKPPRSREESRTLVANLAVLLNQEDRPLRDKELFVSRLDAPLPPDVKAAIHDWVDDHDTLGLLDRLVTLP
jgi:hypothetical protein